MAAAREAYEEDHRLFGFFGVGGGHLPYQTADGASILTGRSTRRRTCRRTRRWPT